MIFKIKYVTIIQNNIYRKFGNILKPELNFQFGSIDRSLLFFYSNIINFKFYWPDSISISMEIDLHA